MDMHQYWAISVCVLFGVIYNKGAPQVQAVGLLVGTERF